MQQVHLELEATPKQPIRCSPSIRNFISPLTLRDLQSKSYKVKPNILSSSHSMSLEAWETGRRYE